MGQVKSYEVWESGRSMTCFVLGHSEEMPLADVLNTRCQAVLLGVAHSTARFSWAPSHGTTRLMRTCKLEVHKCVY